MITDAQIKKCKPSEKRYQLTDGGGLIIEVMPSGRKYWRVDIVVDGRRARKTLGEWPALSVSEARMRAGEMRQRMRDGLPAVEERRQGTTFGAVALEFLGDYLKRLTTESERKGQRRKFELHVLPYLGDLDVFHVRPSDVLACLRHLTDDGKLETAKRVRGLISRVFRYAAAIGLDVTDPAASLIDVLPSPTPKHLATVTSADDVGALMRAISGYPNTVTRCALLFSAYTFCRPGEIRCAEWSEIDEDRAEWRIPAEKMKMRRPHLVPLSRQALRALDEVRPHSGASRWVFVAARTRTRPMCEITVLAALRRLGYAQGEMTAHGFRGMASTILNEHGFDRDWIERQLAHVEGSAVRAAYNHAQYLEGRREMMQWYADHLDALRDNDKGCR